MLYSHSIEENKFNSFALFLSYLVDGNEKYKDAVDSVLEETHKLASNQKDLYSISRSDYPIIVYLKNADLEFFDSLDVQNANVDVYRKVLSIIEEHNTFDFA